MEDVKQDKKINVIEEIRGERTKLYTDFYNNIVPERLPVDFSFSQNMLADYANVDRIEAQFNYGILKEAAQKVCDELYSDGCPIWPLGIISRTPSFYQLLESQSFVMGNNGYMQHPEVMGMLIEDYDYLITDPYACLLERVIPRQHKALSLDNPIKAYMRLMESHYAITSDSSAYNSFVFDLMDKKGYYAGPPIGTITSGVAPCDFLADQLRSFSGFSMDIRRNRGKVIEACDALLPLMLKWSLPDKPDPRGQVVCPLHMPTFMREKDFAEVWLPSFTKMIQQLAAYGTRMLLFCEDNWMRYLDYLMELPSGTILYFEYGDMKKIKDKLGKKFILKGFYPLNLLKTGTKQQCIDKAKEILDVMMPGCGYIFDFDKVPLIGSDINYENYCALAEYLSENAKFDHPGTSFGTPLNTEGYKFDKSMCEYKSKYSFDWEKFKSKYPLTPDFARQNFENYDKQMLDRLLTLLM